MRRRNKAIIIILSTIFTLGIGFVIWAQTPLDPLPEANQALKSDLLVDVSIGKWLAFSPHSFSSCTGFIIYPGGRVNYKSYAPVAHAIAAKGYLVIIAPMPLNLAVLGINKAQDVIDFYPEIQTWIIGGHSLGGTMAAQFAYNNPLSIKGLVLWAAYPVSGTDFSKKSIAVTTIHGLNDGLVNITQIDDSMKILPADTFRVEITGGNHAQFGTYGNQPGDHAATISRDAQQTQIVDSTIQLLKKASSQ